MIRAFSGDRRASQKAGDDVLSFFFSFELQPLLGYKDKFKNNSKSKYKYRGEEGVAVGGNDGPPFFSALNCNLSWDANTNTNTITNKNTNTGEGVAVSTGDDPPFSLLE